MLSLVLRVTMSTLGWVIKLVFSTIYKDVFTHKDIYINAYYIVFLFYIQYIKNYSLTKIYT